MLGFPLSDNLSTVLPSVNRNNLIETFLTSPQCKRRSKNETFFNPCWKTYTFLKIFLLSFLQGSLFLSLLNSLLKLVLLFSLPHSPSPSAISKKYFPFFFCLYFTFSSLTTGLHWLRRKSGACHLSYRRDMQRPPAYSLLFFITAW